MAPDEAARDSRRIDGLLASYGEIMSKVSALEARADGFEKTHERAFSQFSRALEAFDVECDKKVARLEQAQEKHAKATAAAEAALARKFEEAREAQRWTPMAKVGLLAAITGPLGTALVIAMDKL